MNGWWWFTVGALSAGPFVGLALFLLLAEGAHRRGVLAGQAQAELAHGWPSHQVPPSRRGDESWACVDKQTERVPSRPVFYDS